MISVFFFNDTATSEIYTLSLHDALPICACSCDGVKLNPLALSAPLIAVKSFEPASAVWVCATGWGLSQTEDLKWKISSCRSEEHTSELQSHSDLVCRLLLEKKKETKTNS